MKTNIFFLLFCSLSYCAVGQFAEYGFKRALPDITEDYHVIPLPNELFGKVRNDLNDIRIIGINPAGDTIEIPYFIHYQKEQIVEREVEFRLLNESKKDGNYYFTFHIPESNTINKIALDFHETNFDWRINLEGSQDQKEWFTIVDNYRIVSIDNPLTDYKFTTIGFAPSEYRYYRVAVESNIKPTLDKASVTLKEVSEGKYRNYEVKALIIPASPAGEHEPEKSKTTVVDVDLGMEVPVNSLLMKVTDQSDYYRPVVIQYLSDSFKTEKGWKYNYRPLASGVLSSMENKGFSFNSTVLRRLRIIIENRDNKPLNISECQVKGYVYELTARFTEKANYYLIYGNPHARKPDYDILHFKDQIPQDVISINLGEEEEEIPHLASMENQPLFENKIWLWTVMVFIIAILGYFSVRMMKKE